MERAEVADALGYSSGAGGVAARKIAALTQFGLLDRHGGKYSLTALGKDLRSLPESSSDFVQALKSAFEKPSLFREVLQRHVSSSGKIPNNLNELLVRHHGITKKASKEVAQIFERSESFVRAKEASRRPAESLEYPENKASRGKPTPEFSDFFSPLFVDPGKLPKETFQYEPLVLNIGKGKKAYMTLVVPARLTQSDLENLKREVRHEGKHLEKFFKAEDRDEHRKNSDSYSQEPLKFRPPRN